MIESLFWVCLTLLLYAIVGYPLCLLLFARLFGRDASLDGSGPKSFTFLIAAYNEEASIRQKVENSLALAELGGFDVQVIVVSDGSTDRTVEQVTRVEAAA